MKKNRTAAVISKERWARYAMTGAAGVFAAIGINGKTIGDEVSIEVGQLLADTNVDGTFENFGPYTMGGAGASFVFRQAFNETGTDLGILTVYGYGNISFVGSIGSQQFYLPTNLNPNSVVGSAQNFGIYADQRGDMAWEGGVSSGGVPYGSNFLERGQSFLGFRFDLGNGTQYGFVDLFMFGAPDNRAILNSYTYGGVGEFVTTPVPEPSALCSLALGCIGLLAWRKRRRAG